MTLRSIKTSALLACTALAFAAPVLAQQSGTMMTPAPAMTDKPMADKAMNDAKPMSDKTMNDAKPMTDKAMTDKAMNDGKPAAPMMNDMKK